MAEGTEQGRLRAAEQEIARLEGEVRALREQSARTGRRRYRSVVLSEPRLLSPAVGILFWWAALVPSLLPRSALFQGVLGGAAFAVGWAVGALVGQAWDAIWRARRRPDPLAVRRRLLVRLVSLAALVAAVVGSMLWLRWQNQQRTVVGPDEVLGVGSLVTLWVVTILIGAVFIGLGRSYAFLVIRVDDRMPGRLHHRTAAVVSGSAVTIVSALVVTALLTWAVLPYANDTFGAQDATSVAGLAPPQTTTVSGGTGSLVDWETLGHEGQFFTATATSTEAIATLHPEVAPTPPIRVYVGLKNAPDAASRAALAVRELDRTGAFQRKVLVVWTSTGTGWVDPVGAAALEYLHAGNTAIVSMQYSFLPSWISFLVDKDKAADAGQALFQAVYARWSQLPAGSRPRLVAFGESLGSFGMESAFTESTSSATLQRIAGVPDAALFTGPTHDNVGWAALKATRIPSSPVWRPVSGVDPAIQLANHGSEVAAASPQPKVLWIAHPSDPVGWWDWSTIWSRPAWMDQPTGGDVPEQPSWFPLVSWFQSTMDLVNGFSSGPGHGHNYDPDFAGAWAGVAPAEGWTADDSARLAQTLLRVRTD